MAATASTKRIKSGSKNPSWLPSAPRELIDAYDLKQIGNGREILKLLISDQRMEPVWKNLTSLKSANERWLSLWGVIAWAKLRGKQAKGNRRTRSDDRDELQKLARKFSKLAKEIENGPLDLYLYEYLPDDVRNILGIQDWASKNSAERAQSARGLLDCWPTAPELLRGLATHAEQIATDAMTKPRPDERGTGAVAARTFIWHMAPEINHRFGKPLLEELGVIATVVFHLDDGTQFDRLYVENVLNTADKKKAKEVKKSRLSKLKQKSK